MTGHEGQSVGSQLDDVLWSIINRLDALEAVGTPDPDPEPEPPPVDPDPDPDPPPVDPPPSGTRPGPSNTGTTGPLTSSGSITTARDGQVIKDLVVTGGIVVSHNNVTIRNVHIRSTGRYGIQIPSSLHDSVTGLLIEDVEIEGVSGDRSAGIVHYGKWTARRVDVHGFVDGVKMLGGQILEASWIHGLLALTGAHNDGIQAIGGSNSVIRGNTIDNPFGQTAAILIQSHSAITGWTVEGNFLSGGGYTFYLTDKGSGPPSNTTVRNNVWKRGSWQWGPVKIDKGPGLVWSGNTYDDGQPLNV